MRRVCIISAILSTFFVGAGMSRGITPETIGVIINEVYYDAPGTDTGYEFVELYNNAPDAVDMTGYVLAMNDRYTFGSYVLPAYTYVVIHNNADAPDEEFDLYTGPGFDNMGDSHASVALFTGAPGSSTIIDFLQYGEGDGETWESAAVSAGIWTEGDYVDDVEPGYSINLYPDHQDNDTPEDWTDCIPSAHYSNCTIEPTPEGSPTPEPTITPTPTSSGTPGPSPTPYIYSPTPFPTPTPCICGGLILNEVMCNADENDNDFVEIINCSMEAVDVADPQVYISEEDSDAAPDKLLPFYSGGNTVIPPQGFGVILDPNQEDFYDVPEDAVLLKTDDDSIADANISCDEVIVLCYGATGQECEDSIFSTYGGYNSPATAQSVERTDPCADDEPDNWNNSSCEPSSTGRHSIGAANCPPVGLIPPGYLNITEVCPKPGETEGGGNCSEFIEILNCSDETIDLRNVLLTDGETDGPDGPLIFNLLVPVYPDENPYLEPGEMAVILQESYFETADIFTDGEYSDTICQTGTKLLTTDSGSLTKNGMAEANPYLLLNTDFSRISTYLFPVSHETGNSIERIDLCGPDTDGAWAVTAADQQKCGRHSCGRWNTVSPPAPSDAPRILMGGYMDSEISERYGGVLNLTAIAMDPDGAETIDYIDILFSGISYGFHMPLVEIIPLDDISFSNIALYSVDFAVPPGAAPSHFSFSLIPYDDEGHVGIEWPFFHIRGTESICPPYSYSFAPPEFHSPLNFYACSSQTPSVGDVLCGFSDPKILLAGYWTTDLNAITSCRLQMVAAAQPAPGRRIVKVEIYFAGLPTGVCLQDFGFSSDADLEFLDAPNDNIFGIEIPLQPGDLEYEENNRYALGLAAVDDLGNKSAIWPLSPINF